MTFQPLDPEDPAAQVLIAGLSDHLKRLYGYQREHADSVRAMKLPSIYFLGAYVGAELVGCGAVRSFEDACAYAEIKTVFVAEAHQGRGHSKAIMSMLEARMRSMGVAFARLATGVRQPEAISLYASLGYVQCLAFGDHQADPLTIFMEKPLGSGD